MHWNSLGTKVELANGWYLTSEFDDIEFETARLVENTRIYYRCDVAMFEWAGNVLHFQASIDGDVFDLPWWQRFYAPIDGDVVDLRWWLLFDTGEVNYSSDTSDKPGKSETDRSLLIRRTTPDELKQYYPAKFMTTTGTITFHENKSIVIRRNKLPTDAGSFAARHSTNVSKEAINLLHRVRVQQNESSKAVRVHCPEEVEHTVTTAWEQVGYDIQFDTESTTNGAGIRAMRTLVTSIQPVDSSAVESFRSIMAELAPDVKVVIES